MGKLISIGYMFYFESFKSYTVTFFHGIYILGELFNHTLYRLKNWNKFVILNL